VVAGPATISRAANQGRSIQGKPLRFTTNAYPREQRQDAWRFALQRVSLEVVATAEEPMASW
jgi:hypothetical protein